VDDLEGRAFAVALGLYYETLVVLVGTTVAHMLLRTGVGSLNLSGVWYGTCIFVVSILSHIGAFGPAIFPLTTSVVVGGVVSWLLRRPRPLWWSWLVVGHDGTEHSSARRSAGGKGSDGG
jgi:hypothetical protein